MIVDSHCHTVNFSPDSEIQLQDLFDYLDRINFEVESNSGNPLIRKPLRKMQVCITEHYDYDTPDNSPLVFDPKKYFTEFFEFRNKIIEEKHMYNNENFPIKFGIELGYLPHLGYHFNKLLSEYPYDYVIASLHYVNNREPFFDRALYDEGKEKVYSDNLKAIINMLENYSNFDTLGHYDYFSRYSPYADPVMRYSDYPDLFDRMFKLLIEKGKGLEISASTLNTLKNSGIKNYMPDPLIYKRFIELGGEYITFASDAHKINNLFVLYDECIEFLKDIGVKELTYFVSRKPYKYAI